MIDPPRPSDICGSATLTVCMTPVRLMSSIVCQADFVDRRGRGGRTADTGVGDDDIGPAQLVDSSLKRGAKPFEVPDV